MASAGAAAQGCAESARGSRRERLRGALVELERRAKEEPENLARGQLRLPDAIVAEPLLAARVMARLAEVAFGRCHLRGPLAVASVDRELALTLKAR